MAFEGELKVLSDEKNEEETGEFEGIFFFFAEQ